MLLRRKTTKEDLMAVESVRRHPMVCLLVAVLVLPAVAGAARAEPLPLTVRVLGAFQTSLGGRTSGSQGAQVTNLEEQGQWYGVEVDWRPHPLFSLDVGVSKTGINEIHFAPAPGGNGPFGGLDRTFRSASLRQFTVAPLYHPVRGDRQVDFYLGPAAGIAAYTRAFASSQTELTYGGKIGFDVHLARSHWSVGGDLTVLSNHLRIFDGQPQQQVTYSRLAAAIAYHWQPRAPL
jgi:hypothetical protein